MHFRSLLFVPGNKVSMLRKSDQLPADAFRLRTWRIRPDAEKANTRANTIASFLPELAATGIPVIPRVNALDTGWTADDLAAVVGPHIYGISIGKIHVPDDVRQLSELLDGLENQSGLEAGRIKLFLWLESAKAIVHCYEICSASPRIEGVAFGGEDFTHDMGIERLEDESEVAVARNLLCIAARAAEIQALDTPYFRFRDEAGLRENCAKAKAVRLQGQVCHSPGPDRGDQRVLFAIRGGDRVRAACGRGVRRCRARRTRVHVAGGQGDRRSCRKEGAGAAAAR